MKMLHRILIAVSMGGALIYAAQGVLTAMEDTPPGCESRKQILDKASPAMVALMTQACHWEKIPDSHSEAQRFSKYWSSLADKSFSTSAPLDQKTFASDFKKLLQAELLYYQNPKNPKLDFSPHVEIDQVMNSSVSHANDDSIIKFALDMLKGNSDEGARTVIVNTVIDQFEKDPPTMIKTLYKFLLLDTSRGEGICDKPAGRNYLHELINILSSDEEIKSRAVLAAKDELADLQKKNSKETLPSVASCMKKTIDKVSVELVNLLPADSLPKSPTHKK